MSTVIIIGGGGGSPRATLTIGIGAPVAAGESVDNQTSATAYLTFINNAMQLEDIFLDAGKAHAFTEPGAVTLQS